ncbi:P-loop containing nucleoside triphosphate hydrolase protein [Fusarium tricinctum]|uniref:Gluconokinase n=1 Tax=Fusarium tricinctum TaxID=61284 RepID=A0A8K0WCI8_9HYPO|nr:P-loop containing nucleoside triphosphate hydrolase protein [Fusarium tricinctum]
MGDLKDPAVKPAPEGHRWILFVSGPTASGKTSVAKFIAEKLDLKFVEGDDFHPKTNIEKMSHGQPLTDEDRYGWLQALHEHATHHPIGPGTEHLVVTCSALKREYRDILREGTENAGDLRVHFLHLDAPEEVLKERAAARKGHFAGAALVHSQFEVLERPQEDEKDVLTVSVDQKVEDVQKEALRRVRELFEDDPCGGR